MGQIYLVRHGQASFGSDNYDQLSPLGEQQARLLGEWLAGREQRFDRVVIGALQRHRQSAEACMGVLERAGLASDDWHTDAGFNEYNHHEITIRERPEFADPLALKRFLGEGEEPGRRFQRVFQDAMLRWMSGQFDADYEEPWPQFRARCLAALERVLNAAGASQNVIVFTSGGTIATLCQHLLGLSDRKMAELNWGLVNAAVTRLLYRPGQVTLSSLNNYAHLEWPGQKHLITYR